MKSILGTKVGMTQVFTTHGKKVPITVVYVEPNQVLAVKSESKDGYDAVQVGYHTLSDKKLNKPDLGQFKKVHSEPKRFIRELRGIKNYEVGQTIGCDIFETGELVDIQGTSKGHGFTGAIKRHNFSIGSKGHGAGYPHRYIGSIANGRGGSQAQRVFKGKKMPGHYGHETVTTKNLVVVNVDKENNLIFIKGAVPGPKNGLLKIKSSVNKPEAKADIQMLNRFKEQVIKPELDAGTTEDKVSE